MSISSSNGDEEHMKCAHVYIHTEEPKTGEYKKVTAKLGTFYHVRCDKTVMSPDSNIGVTGEIYCSEHAQEDWGTEDEY